MVGSAHVGDNALPNLRSSNNLAAAGGDYYNTHWHQTSTTDATVSEILNSNGRISTGPVLRF